jgi:hypothetical protein
MKIKNLTFSKNLLKELISSNIHISKNKSCITKDYYMYVDGFRGNCSVINLNYTFIHLKKLYIVFNFLLKVNKKIIFLGSPKWLNYKWKFLENYSNNNFIFLNYNWQSKFFQKNYKDIGLVFVFNDYGEIENIKKETSKYSLCLAGFSNNTIKFFDFPIVGDFNSKNSVIFFFTFYFIV